MSTSPSLDLTPEADAPVDTYITFGVQYGAPPREEHPVFPWVSGDGFVRITSPSREAARALAFAIFGRAWAFDYTEPPEPKWAPLGELAHITLGLEVTPMDLKAIIIDGQHAGFTLATREDDAR